MIISVYIPFLAGCLLALAAPLAGRWLAPAAATLVLTALAALSVAATTGSLVLVAIGGLLKALPSAESQAAWALAALDSVPWQAGAAAAAVLAVLAGRLVRAAVLEDRAWRDLRAVACPGDRGLLVLDDERAYAYAVPAGAGTVIVSSAMLASLDPAERAALLAHERAHLAHRHHLYRIAGALCLALNPALGRLEREVRLQTERWADESAAGRTSRRVAAASLARAALAAASAGPRRSLAYAADSVRERLDALAASPVHSRWPAVLPALLVTAIAAGALLDASRACFRIIEMLGR